MKKPKPLLIGLAAIWCLVLLVSIAGATYAWFTFQPYTNVEPISSTVSSGEVALLISAERDGEFTQQCHLPQAVSGNLDPVSTADLVHFYRAGRQTRQGITISYGDATSDTENVTIHGTFYLQSLKDGCEVYFYRPNLDFGADTQMLAALRLGLKFTGREGEQTYIFDLDQMGNTAGSAAVRTAERAASVVAGIGQDGSAVYAADPALSLSDYFAVGGGENSRPNAGNRKLCTIDAGEIVTVEYWLYLEGCDDNCSNEVQNREAALALSFAGVTAQE